MQWFSMPKVSNHHSMEAHQLSIRQTQGPQIRQRGILSIQSAPVVLCTNPGHLLGCAVHGRAHSLKLLGFESVSFWIARYLKMVGDSELMC